MLKNNVRPCQRWFLTRERHAKKFHHKSHYKSDFISGLVTLSLSQKKTLFGLNFLKGQLSDCHIDNFL